MAFAASFVATHIYYASLEDEKGAVMDESVAWTIVGGLSGLFVSFQTCFLLLMKRKFVSTFFSPQTGHAWVKSFFLDYEEDRIKMFLHGQNRKQWASIRDDVKQFTMENWERWEEEKPAWFNDNFKASLDDAMIPAASLRKLNGADGRRRSSLGDLLGGGERRGSSAIVPVVSFNS
jgi:hypothetical protein